MARLVDLKIGTKISLGFVTLIALVCAVSAMSYYNGHT